MSGVPKPRRTARLAKSLDKQVNLYTLAARAGCRLNHAAAVGAAGAAVMSLAPIAEAKIIYTATHVQIRQSSSFLLDFNFQPKVGDVDFIIDRGRDCKSLSGCHSGMDALGYNSHRSIAVTSHGSAIALRPGQRMGPRKGVSGRAQMAFVEFGGPTNTTVWFGQWGNGGEGLKNGYLGLKFVLNGKVHYGWARVSLTVKNNRFNTATLTGYAFETIPNKSIIIGKTQGPDVIVEPATLGHLAAGANARSPWRTRGDPPHAQTDVAPDGR
jgi:hypothetical protein